MACLLSENCQTNDPNNTHPMKIESSQFPLDNSMHILFTGHFNGFGVEIKSLEEGCFLYHMGCFGKGSASRSRPTRIQNDEPIIMRKRQYLKRSYWYKKFVGTEHKKDRDTFFKNVDELMSKIASAGRKKTGRDIIDLVSTDEDENKSTDTCTIHNENEYYDISRDNIAVIVPNSDSEDDNYFSSMKPQSSFDKIKLEEKLMLTLQEGFFLLYGLGCLQIMTLDNKILSIEECWNLFVETERSFVEKYIVYHYFKTKGYVVKPGIKFGGDYLLYKEGPGVNHADYIVVIKSNKDNMEWTSVLGHVRMANTTVKNILIAEVIKSTKENIKLPQDLCEYSVREIILTRNIPAAINNDDE